MPRSGREIAVMVDERLYYKSMISCANALGLQISHVSECCAGIRNRHKGYCFRYADKEDRIHAGISD